MKLVKIIAMLAAVVGMTISANAQYDLFGASRTIQLLQPQVVTTTSVSNNPVDIRGFDGIAKIDIAFATNTGGGSIVVQAFNSDDRTNWSALTNYAVATLTAQKTTNTFYGTALVETNNFLLPGTFTTPTASTAGWATPYIVPAAFTNGGSQTLAAGQVYTWGFNIGDAKRYIVFKVTGGSAGTNVTVGATLTALRAHNY